MKNLSIITLITLFVAVSAFSQSDSVLFIKKADFSFYKMTKVNSVNSHMTHKEEDISWLDDVNRLAFLSSDSVSLSNSSGKTDCISLSNIKDVNKFNNRISLLVGTGVGAVSGAMVGGIIGSMTSGGLVFSKGEMVTWGILLGSLGGGIIGALITFVINETNFTALDLSSVPDKEKKSKLIRFLKNN